MTLLLCTDLDRTLIPNGAAPESPGARDVFARVARRDDVRLVYVTGRDLALTEDAIAEHALPIPDVAITDVGTTIRRRDGDGWTTSDAWAAELAADWGDRGARDLHALLADLEDLALQDAARQGRFKLSYTTAATERPAALLDEIGARLRGAGVAATVVWSVDDVARVGLVDVLPRRAGKLDALRFVASDLGVPTERMLFGGDSGNDLDVLASDVPAVLVANATDEVRARARAMANERGTTSRLFLARGGFAGMNGNYAAGLLEGLAHFHPEFVRETVPDDG